MTVGGGGPVCLCVLFATKHSKAEIIFCSVCNFRSRRRELMKPQMIFKANLSFSAQVNLAQLLRDSREKSGQLSEEVKELKQRLAEALGDNKVKCQTVQHNHWKSALLMSSHPCEGTNGRQNKAVEASDCVTVWPCSF